MRNSQVLNRSNLALLGGIALVGAVALWAVPTLKKRSRRRAITHPVAESEPSIDKSLKDTYPASDPPASRYFDIPVNRR